MPAFSAHFSFPSSINNLSRVEAVIDDLVANQIISEALYGNVIVAATEATLNAINHGNQGDPKKQTHVQIDANDLELSIVVEDEGSGFDYKNLPDPTDPQNLEKVNGRGIFIIQNLADQMLFEENGKRLKMIFRLTSPALVGA